MQFNDALPLELDAPRRTNDGFMAVRARVARAGVYDYLGKEVDPTGSHFKPDQVVKVYRPATEVFDKKSVSSFVAKPITNDHPSVAVTADNWDGLAKGTIMGALRDDEYLAFDLMVMDSQTISDIESGKSELSNGYTTELVLGDGKTADGLSYNATQTDIRGNHIAVVDKGRAGPDCKIPSGGNSFAVCDANPALLSGFQKKETKVTKLTLDGLVVDISDAEAVSAAFTKLQDAAKTAETSLADSSKQVGTLTAEKAVLEKKLNDALAVDHDKLAADRAALVDTAKAVKSDIVTDGKSSDEIRKEIVTADLGDVAAEFDAAQIAAAFAVIAKDAKVEDGKAQNIKIPTQANDGWSDKIFASSGVKMKGAK